MKKGKNTILATVLVFSMVALIVSLSKCSRVMVRTAESLSAQQISDIKIKAIATKSSLGIIEEDSIAYELKETGPKVIKRNITLKKRYGDGAEYSQRPILKQSDFGKTNTAYIVKHDFDLMGGTIVIPADCELVFNGGSLNNGIIVGNNTSIVYSGAIFNGIGIKGNWNVPEIRSSMFGDAATCCDRLRDLIALTNDKVENSVFIEPGEYSFGVNKYSDKLIPLNNHTTLFLDGTIKVMGCSYPRYSIISVIDVNDVTVKGSGKIVGDKELHVYTPEVPDPESKRGLNSSHEYGHGIEVVRSEDISISGITITNCIGDGICIDGKNVTCTDLIINNCRRQGISVVGGEGISISGCAISDVWGVNHAGFGIDIEPSGTNTATQVNISKCGIYSCNGGINCQSHTFESVNGVEISDSELASFAKDNLDKHDRYRAFICTGSCNIVIKNCSFDDVFSLLTVTNARDIHVVDCKLVTRGASYCVYFRENRGNVFIERNSIFAFDSKSKDAKGVVFLNLHNAVITDNQILSDNLSQSDNTDCYNVILKNNTIDAMWNPGRNLSDCRIENNTFSRRVSLDNIIETSISGNTMPSLKVRSSSTSRVNSNTIKQ